jgi:hypothetical protein
MGEKGGGYNAMDASVNAQNITVTSMPPIALSGHFKGLETILNHLIRRICGKRIKM